MLGVLFRRYEHAVWKVHYASCEERHAVNKALLSSPMCDKGRNELAFSKKVKCDEARKENSWGIWVCAVSSRFSENTVAEALAYARDSWYVFIFLLVAVVVAIRSHWNSRAEVAKHRLSMDTLERLAPHLQQQQGGQIQRQQLQPPLPPFHQHRGVPSLQGYRRDAHGRLVHVDERSRFFALGNSN